MKRLNFKVMTALVAVFMLIFSTVVSAADPKTYDAAKAFADKKQGPVFFWQNKDGGSWKDYTNFKDDWSCWTLVANPGADNVYVNLGLDNGALYLHSANNKAGEAVPIAVAWKAPAAGKVTIKGGTVEHHGNGDTNPHSQKVWIELNGTKVSANWTAKDSSGKNPVTSTGEAVIVNGGTADFADVTVDVKAGDVIRFVADSTGRPGNNSLYWPISLSQVEEAAATNTNTNTNTNVTNSTTGDSGLATYGIIAVIALAGIVLFARKRQQA